MPKLTLLLAIWVVSSAQAIPRCFRLTSLNPALNQLRLTRLAAAKAVHRPDIAKAQSQDPNHLAKFSPYPVSIRSQLPNRSTLHVGDTGFEHYEQTIVPNTLEVLELVAKGSNEPIIGLRVGKYVYYHSSVTGLEKVPFRYYVNQLRKDQRLTGFALEASPLEMEKARLYLETKLAGGMRRYNVAFNNCSQLVRDALKTAGLPTPSRTRSTLPALFLKSIRKTNTRFLGTLHHEAHPTIDELPYWLSASPLPQNEPPAE